MPRMHNLQSQHFPFLDVDGNVRNRTTFYSTLSKMLFMEPHTVRFASFMQPFKNQLVALQSMHPEALRQENYKVRFLFSRARSATLSFFLSLCIALLVPCSHSLISYY